MANTPNTGIPYVTEGALDPAAGLNLALNVIDALLQTAVISIGDAEPPSDVSDGDLFIVGTGAGDWAGEDDNLARYVSEGDFWQFYDAGVQVHIVFNKDDGGLYAYDGSNGWTLAAGLTDAPSDGSTYGRKNGSWAAVTAGSGGAAPVVTESGANLDATPSNSGNYTRFTNADPTYTFEPGSEDYTVGDEYHGRYDGSGSLEIVAGSGFTINPPAGGTLIIPDGGTFTVKIVATDEADLFGVTEAES